MEDITVEQLLNWIRTNWAIVTVVLGYFVQISPIKVYPVEWIKKFLKWLGQYLTVSVDQRMDALDEKIDNLEIEMSSYQMSQDMSRITELRWQILDFADAIARRDYSHEAYEHIIDEVEVEYEMLLAKHNLKNGKATRALDRIKASYNAKIAQNPRF